MDASRIAAARVSTPPLASQGSAVKGEAKVPFSDHIKNAILDANQSLVEAEHKSAELARGQGDIVETVTSLSRAELSLRHVVTLRNRLLESYQQIMRLQL